MPGRVVSDVPLGSAPAAVGNEKRQRQAPRRLSSGTIRPLPPPLLPKKKNGGKGGQGGNQTRQTKESNRVATYVEGKPMVHLPPNRGAVLDSLFVAPGPPAMPSTRIARQVSDI
jgi:hypothetical protein